MKKTIKLLGITAIVAAIGFSLAGCDNGSTDNGKAGGDGEGKTITVSLNKVSATSFTLTVNGAKFKSANGLIRDDQVTATYVTGNSTPSLWSTVFGSAKSSDTMYTYTLQTATYTGISGTIRLNVDNLNSYRNSFDGISSKDTIAAGSSSITF